ncbi:hypothetical protein T492DRAFT_1101787 [Pavlovales sp. CCMP2436]|nr:hypothetical protein T492DRAFT_1101787 [Pavlovales sp. CCMP2436]
MVAALIVRSPADLSRAETQLAATQLPEAPRDKFPLASRPFDAHRTSKPTERFWNARLPCRPSLSATSHSLQAWRECTECGGTYLDSAAGYEQHAQTVTHMDVCDPVALTWAVECQTQQSLGVAAVRSARRSSPECPAWQAPSQTPSQTPCQTRVALPYTLQGDGAIPYCSKPGGRSVFTVASRRVAFRRSAGRYTSPQVDV